MNSSTRMFPRGSERQSYAGFGTGSNRNTSAGLFALSVRARADGLPECFARAPVPPFVRTGFAIAVEKGFLVRAGLCKGFAHAKKCQDCCDRMDQEPQGREPRCGVEPPR